MVWWHWSITLLHRRGGWSLFLCSFVSLVSCKWHQNATCDCWFHFGDTFRNESDSHMSLFDHLLLRQVMQKMPKKCFLFSFRGFADLEAPCMQNALPFWFDWPPESDTIMDQFCETQSGKNLGKECWCTQTMWRQESFQCRWRWGMRAVNAFLELTSPSCQELNSEEGKCA